MRRNLLDNPIRRTPAQAGCAVAVVAEPCRAFVASQGLKPGGTNRPVDVVTGVVAFMGMVVSHTGTTTHKPTRVTPVTCVVTPDREPQPRTSRPRERVLRSDRG